MGLGIKHFYALGVWVVTHRELPGYRLGIFSAKKNDIRIMIVVDPQEMVDRRAKRIHEVMSIFRGRFLHHFLLGIFEALSHVVHGLVLRDGVLLEGRFGRVERPQLRLAANGVLELAERRQEAGTIGFQGSVLPAESELDGEPVALQPRAKREAWVSASVTA